MEHVALQQIQVRHVGLCSNRLAIAASRMSEEAWQVDSRLQCRKQFCHLASFNSMYGLGPWTLLQSWTECRHHQHQAGLPVECLFQTIQHILYELHRILTTACQLAVHVQASRRKLFCIACCPYPLNCSANWPTWSNNSNYLGCYLLGP